MIMSFHLMAGMVMVVRPVLSRMVVIMDMGRTAVGMVVKMFVHVLMSMGMSMLMGVHLAVVRVLVGVRMGVFMRMQMLVFVFSFHDESSLP